MSQDKIGPHISIHFVQPKSKVHHPKVRCREGHAMHLLKQCFFWKTQFLYRILLGFWHFESRRISPNLNPKFCFQPRCGQAAMWSEVTFSGTAPTARDAHTAVWSEAANGMYIFGGSPVLGAAAGKRWRVPQPKDGRSCAEASSTTCISLTARPPESMEVGVASEQFPFGFARLWDFNCLETGETSNISCHQPCHFASYFFVSIPFLQPCWHCACESL